MVLVVENQIFGTGPRKVLGTMGSCVETGLGVVVSRFRTWDLTLASDWIGVDCESPQNGMATRYQCASQTIEIRWQEWQWVDTASGLSR
jgi:hypothetical protein